MFKFMKYEIRGSYRFVLATILVVALATIGIQYSASRIDVNLGPDQGSLAVLQLLLPILIIAIIAASIAFVVYLIQSYRKELYEDRGYLTFTLPIGGKKILGAKFITAVLWSVLFGGILVLVNLLAFNILFGGSILDQLSFQFIIVINELGRGVLSGLLFYSAISSLVTLLTVYFSITLSKVAIKSRNIGGLWIFIFIGLQMLFSFIEARVIEIFPVFTSLGDGFSSMNNLMTTEFGLTVDIMTGSPVLSLSAIIYWIALGIGLFVATGYLLDRKIEL